jgi:quinolinate synthase
VKVVESLPKDQPIIFAPDKHLGAYVQRVTGRRMTLWNGACEVHVEISLDKLVLLLGKHPKARLIAHPECPEHILEHADHIGSTASLLEYVQRDASKEFIVATEAGILHNMRQMMPEKTFIPAPANTNNTCACSECPYMKLNTVKKVHDALKYNLNEIVLEEDVRLRAEQALRRMLAVR